MQVILEIREKELEAKQMELSKILAALNSQRARLDEIRGAQENNIKNIEELSTGIDFDIVQVEMHKNYGMKLATDAANQQRIISNTESILKVKQKEVLEAHQKVEVLKKLKEKQEKEFYKEFLEAETKEIDDITSARFRLK